MWNKWAHKQWESETAIYRQHAGCLFMIGEITASPACQAISLCTFGINPCFPTLLYLCHLSSAFSSLSLLSSPYTSHFCFLWILISLPHLKACPPPFLPPSFPPSLLISVHLSISLCVWRRNDYTSFHSFFLSSHFVCATAQINTRRRERDGERNKDAGTNTQITNLLLCVYVNVSLSVRTKRGQVGRGRGKGWGINREEIHRKGPHRNTL